MGPFYVSRSRYNPWKLKKPTEESLRGISVSEFMRRCWDLEEILHHQITKATAHKSKASKLNLEDKLSSLWDLKQWSQKTIENHTFFEYVKYLAHVTYHNAYNLLLFYREIEIGVELMNGYDKSKVDFFSNFNSIHFVKNSVIENHFLW